jgi:hypothetical protein
MLTSLSTDKVKCVGQIIGAGTTSPLLAAHVSWVNKGQFTSTAWAGVDLIRITGWKTVGEAFGWLQDNNANGETRYSSTYYAAGSTISWRDSGSHLITAGCWHIGGILIPVVPA